MEGQTLAPIHPGNSLESFLSRWGSVSIASPRAFKFHRDALIIQASRGVRTLPCALLQFFGTSERWMNLQVRYDLEVEKIASVTASPGGSAAGWC